MKRPDPPVKAAGAATRRPSSMIGPMMIARRQNLSMKNVLTCLCFFACLTEPGWRNWQTQRTQNPPGFGPWGFDSPSRHHPNATPFWLRFPTFGFFRAALRCRLPDYGYRRPLPLDKLSPSVIRMATAGYYKRSQHDYPGGWPPERPSTHHLMIWPVLCAVLRPRTVNMKRGLEKPTRTGQTGTPSS